MKIKEILDYLTEKKGKPWKANQYPRHWNKETNLWSYSHREKLGLGPNDRDKVVHHKDGDINNFHKRNLQILTRGEHAAIGKPALKHEKCRYCGEKHFAKGLCRKHYYKKFRK